MHIEARAASDREKLNTDEENVMGFDSTDVECQFFLGLDPGDWVIEISDQYNILQRQEAGLFHVHITEEGDSGFCKKIEPDRA